MSREEKIKVILRFLKEAKCYSEFFKEFNLKDDRYNKYIVTLEDLFSICSLNDIINKAFLWEDTLRGHRYWSKRNIALHNIFKEILNYEYTRKNQYIY